MGTHSAGGIYLANVGRGAVSEIPFTLPDGVPSGPGSVMELSARVLERLTIG